MHMLQIPLSYCNMYDVYLFNMVFTKFLLTQILGDFDGKQVVVNKMFI